MSNAFVYLLDRIVYFPELEEDDWEMYPEVDLTEVVF